MIVVGGEALVDLVDDGGSRRAVAGGGPFNTAIAFGRLGVPAAFLGAISRDGHGLLLGRLLADAGVATTLIRHSDLPTPTATVHRLSGGGNTYTFSLTATAFTDLSPDALPTLPENAWALHVGTLALALDPPAAAYEALVDREARKLSVILDPNVRPLIFGDAGTYRERFERHARLSDVVKLSDDDAAFIYPDRRLDDVLTTVLELGPRVVAVTRGAQGAIARSRTASVAVPGIPVRVVDTVGAGDSFGAALVTALLDHGALGPGRDADVGESVLAEATTYAVAASAITCTRVGAVPPSREEIGALLRDADSAVVANS